MGGSAWTGLKPRSPPVSTSQVTGIISKQKNKNKNKKNSESRQFEIGYSNNSEKVLLHQTSKIPYNMILNRKAQITENYIRFHLYKFQIKLVRPNYIVRNLCLRVKTTK
jgi:hypothetical protein